MSRILTAMVALLLFIGSAQAGPFYQFILDTYTVTAPPTFDFDPPGAGDTLLSIDLFSGAPAGFDGDGCSFASANVAAIRIGDDPAPVQTCIDGWFPVYSVDYALVPDGGLGLLGAFYLNVTYGTFDMASDADGLWTGTFTSDNDATGCFDGEHPCTFTGRWVDPPLALARVPGPSELALLLVGGVALAGLARKQSG